jgi:NADPH-dependent glutamate synthase beta subunit-like oxidoreductase/Pyruvate/2-oxoacid:ferredoxin oxidoreductase delta subunit
VIINTTILGAYARMLDVPLAALEQAFAALGLADDLPAAEHAYASVRARAAAPDAAAASASLTDIATGATAAPVMPLPEHRADLPVTLRTGTWSTQLPRYRNYGKHGNSGDPAAPCNLACPAGNDVVGFIQALKNDGLAPAAAILLRTQPLPSVCGRVCPAPCMTAGNRDAFAGAFNIRGLERWIGDQAAFAPTPMAQPAPRRFAVAGGGPAGLSAAYQLALRGHAVTIFEAGPALGGVLRTGIPAFRLAPPDLQRDLDRLLALGVQARCNRPLDAGALERLRAEYDAVIVCTGFGAATALDVPGAGLPGVEQGLPFLDRVKRGGVKVHGQVVVIGGGNTAIDCARSALRCGAAGVRLAYRRGREEMPAIREEIDAAEQEGMRLLPLRQPLAFTGDAGASRLTGVVLAEVELGAPDASGRRRPTVTQRSATLACDRVLLALGQAEGLAWLPSAWQVRDGRAWADGQPLAVWFAGDCASADGTVTHAIGNGRRSALMALASLERLESGLEDSARAASPASSAALASAAPKSVTPGEIRFSHFGVAPPHRDRELPLAARLAGFDEVNLGLAGPDEADRCFSCGRCTQCDNCLIYCPDGVIYRSDAGPPYTTPYTIDADYCKGCGMCVAECPRDAMEMVEKGRGEENRAGENA